MESYVYRNKISEGHKKDLQVKSHLLVSSSTVVPSFGISISSMAFFLLQLLHFNPISFQILSFMLTYRTSKQFLPGFFFQIKAILTLKSLF